jgi:hypothetical protein
MKKRRSASGVVAHDSGRVSSFNIEHSTLNIQHSLFQAIAWTGNDANKTINTRISAAQGFPAHAGDAHRHAAVGRQLGV